MPNVQISLSVEKYNALASKIEDLTAKKSSSMNLLSIFCFKKSKIIKKLMGPEKYDLFMELSDEAKEKMEN